LNAVPAQPVGTIPLIRVSDSLRMTACADEVVELEMFSIGHEWV
jgi:hypothetical protein